ncbi:MAG: FGGY family carbohydrate kinase [Thermomicrobiales bacterium]
MIWKLTGGKVHATDATNASRTLLFDIRRQAWSDEMLDLFDVPAGDPAQGPRLRRRLRATEQGLLGAAIPIRGRGGRPAGGADGAGVHCARRDEGDLRHRLLHAGQHRRDPGGARAPRLLTTVAARVAGRTTYALEGSIFIAGAALQWVNEGLGVDGGGAAVEALARTAQARTTAW